AKDGEGGAMNMVLWWHPGNDVTGMVARSSRIVTACEKVLKGSHLCGRINHKKQGYQVGADLDRIVVIEKCCPKEYVEMDPGCVTSLILSFNRSRTCRDVLFFDCNLLHCSSENLSDKRRWAFLCAYSSVTDAPLTNHKPSLYTPLDTVPDSAILDCKQFQPNDEEKLFYNPETDVLDDLPFKQNTEEGKE
ncbi:hypothetical protein MAR_033371, partial [Mya arenaria]